MSRRRSEAPLKYVCHDMHSVTVHTVQHELLWRTATSEKYFLREMAPLSFFSEFLSLTLLLKQLTGIRLEVFLRMSAFLVFLRWKCKINLGVKHIFTSEFHLRKLMHYKTKLYIFQKEDSCSYLVRTD